ncbi:VOC family protein [Phragmitibacter flavus]|uniref:VOC family protein n=1 Tax=Phragmitibacter flavus TaxID=2576071 RepID=A0A5R8KBN5_9BACT|nr:glyoxalase superfamily protein [Phragmitibacter flavus]TLD68969.1 VOC family protein [Phragmitibacter flavus]
MQTTCASPILQVKDLQEALSFYIDVLGFSEDFVYGDPPYYAGVKYGEVIFHLCSSEEGEERLGKGAVYVFCDEVDGYYAKIISRGAEVTSPLNTYPYGMRDFQIKDKDGNLLTFGTSVEEV